MRLGRARYEAFSEVWPDPMELADGKDALHPGCKAMSTYVVSTTLADDVADRCVLLVSSVRLGDPEQAGQSAIRPAA